MCQSSFEGFIASFANFLLQIKHKGEGASESPVAINPYCKYDFMNWRLKDAFFFFMVVSSSSDGVVSFAKKLNIKPVTIQYQVAEGSPLPVVGQFQSTASIDGKSPGVTFPVIVTKVSDLNLLGRLAMMKLKLTNLTDHCRENLSCAESTTTIEHVTTSSPKNSLHAACIQLSGEFPTLFESNIGLSKRFFTGHTV